jgi:hypothetical protein
MELFIFLASCLIKYMCIRPMFVAAIGEITNLIIQCQRSPSSSGHLLDNYVFVHNFYHHSRSNKIRHSTETQYKHC